MLKLSILFLFSDDYSFCVLVTRTPQYNTSDFKAMPTPAISPLLLAPTLSEVRPGRTLNVLECTLNDKVGGSKATAIRLICVHGTAANHEQYLPFLQDLAEQLPNITFHCLLYDAVGCGRSPKLPKKSDYSDEQQVEDLIALVNRQDTGLEASGLPIFFVGHSYGPNWIYKLLLRQKDRDRKTKIAGLVLLSSGVANPKYSLQKGGPKLFSLPVWFLKCLQPLLSQSFMKLGYSSHTHDNRPELIRAAKEASNTNDMTVVCHYYQSHDWIASQDIVTHLQPFYPTPLILHGQDDQIVPLECGQALCNAWNVPLTVVPDASHMVNLEQPKHVAKHVAAYIEEYIVKFEQSHANDRL